MKKEYLTPMAEKIRFNYRDQVVAASGDGVSSNNPYEGYTSQNLSTCYTGGSFGDYLANLLGICDLFG